MIAAGNKRTDQHQNHLQWYSRREGVIRGPFTAKLVTRYLLLGRIRLNDELSTDRASWSPADSFARLLPSEVVNLNSWDDYQQLVEARMQVDERKSGRRCQDCPNRDKCNPERRIHGERRHMDDSVLVGQYLYNNSGRQITRRPLLLTLLLVTLMYAWQYPGMV